VRIDALQASIEFQADDAPPYPEPLHGVVRALGPEGRFHLSGSLPLGSEVDYRLEVRTSGGTLAPESLPFPFTDVHGHAVVHPKTVTIGAGGEDRIFARAFAGSVRAQGVFDIDSQRLEGSFDATELELAAIVASLRPDAGEDAEPTAGFGRLSAEIAADFAPEEPALEARGDFEVRGASFFAIPVLSSLLDLVPGIGTLEAGEGAGRFQLESDRVRLDPVLVWGPAVGLHGSGNVGLDAELALEATVVPLGAWRQQLRKLGVPLLGTVASELAGALQSVAQTATSTLLYRFDVGGTLSDPRIQPVPAPAVTDAAGRTLAWLLRADEPGAGGDDPPPPIEILTGGDGEGGD
jgi:hypothetical protein